jgi:hypothetical protein
MLTKIADSGLDLTINQGTAGYTKDVMIVTVATQSLSIISNYFMLLWIVVSDSIATPSMVTVSVCGCVGM